MNADQVSAAFSQLMHSPLRMIVFHSLFLAILVWVLCKQINEGLERFNRVAMPVLACLLVVMTIYAAFTGNFLQAIEFLFYPDFSKFSAEVVIQASGQAFFSLGVAAGGVMAYGTYLGAEQNIPKSAATIAVADTAVALLAGMIIFPLVFSAGIEPSAGPGLIFVALPTAISSSPLGSILLTLFFILIFVAATTTALSMLECPIRVFVEKANLTRKAAAICSALIVWVLGVFALLSFNVLKNTFPLGYFQRFQSKTIFDLMDYFVANIFMPFNGLLIVVLAGWFMKESELFENYGNDGRYYPIWRGIICYVAPIGLIVLFTL